MAPFVDVEVITSQNNTHCVNLACVCVCAPASVSISLQLTCTRVIRNEKIACFLAESSLLFY